MKAGVIPDTVVVVFAGPATTTAIVDTCGATWATPSTCAMASASSIVSVSPDPPAPRTKPDMLAPGLMLSRLVPRPSMRLVMPDVAPCATETSATMDPTPMITPSIVRSARSRAAASRERARGMSSAQFTRRASRRGP